MGVVFVEGTVTGPTGKQATLEFLVDSGATCTLLPKLGTSFSREWLRHAAPLSRK